MGSTDHLHDRWMLAEGPYDRAVFDLARALFERADGWFFPSALTTGPWRADAMHGGPPSALIGRAIEHAVDHGEHVSRINIELERPVPLEPLQTVVVRRQISRRVAYLDIQLRTGDCAVTSARALLLRGEPILGGSRAVDEPPRLVGSEWAVRPPGAAHDAPVLYHRDAVEHRFVAGGFEVPGPSTAWIRLASAIVAGEEAGALSQLLAVADFGSAIAQGLEPDLGVGLINVDVSVALARRPVGQWFLLSSTDVVTADGIGLAHTELSDLTGRLGIATHSQLTHGYPR
jgi:hypothetical protein